MLKALNRLGDVGVRVIKASKDATIETLRQLNPVLTELANSGDDFVKSFNVFLTYPFVDEVVGRDPQVARNLHMGDYTNLSVELDLDVSGGASGTPTGLPTNLPRLPRPDGDPRQRSPGASAAATSPARRARRCSGPPQELSAAPAGVREAEEPRTSDVCKQLNTIPGLPTPSGGGLPLPSSRRPACRVPGLGRTSVWSTQRAHGPTMGQLMQVFDPALVQPARARDGDPMITRRTKLQLLVFVVITLLGCQLRRRPVRPPRPAGPRRPPTRSSPTSRTPAASSPAPRSPTAASGSGGSASCSSPTTGVDVLPRHRQRLRHDPADTLAVVGNRSAVGEQYVELQPQTDNGPYLERRLPDRAGRHPHPDPDPEAAHRPLRTPSSRWTSRRCAPPSSELGKAFGGTGQDLQRIIDTGNSFIKDANANFDTTTALIRDGNTVLHGQVASASAIRTFARDLSLFSGTLAGSDRALRAGHRRRLGDREPAAHVPRGEPGRPRRADQQPGHHRRRRGQAPRPASSRSW